MLRVNEMSNKKELRGFGSHLQGGIVEVYSDGEYRLVTGEGESKLTAASLQMQSGDPSVLGLNGFTIEDLLNVAIDRITAYNEAVPHVLNDGALTMIRQAKLNLKLREDRQAKAREKAEVKDKPAE